MSLNGLDNVEVTQAYQGTLAEAGGWYDAPFAAQFRPQANLGCTGSCSGTSRGTPSRSSPAAPAALERRALPWPPTTRSRRSTASCCTAAARSWSSMCPRGPRDCSKVSASTASQKRPPTDCAQARVAVHFLTVTDKFAPCDIVLSISTPEELSDAALASACTLHTAAPSSSSSNGSLRQQKLSWIQEAAEEGSQMNGDETALANRSLAGTSPIPTILEPTGSDAEDPPRNTSIASQAESVPVILEEKVVASKPTPDISHVTIETVTEATTPESDLTELHATLKSYDRLFEGGPEPRLSSQTARPNYDELYEHYYAQYTKPKVKLGPRPRPSLEGKRPATSGSTSQDVARPKSSLPAGLRSATRKAVDQKTLKARTPNTVPNIAIPPPPPIPMTPEMPQSPVSTLYTSRSPASVRSMPVTSYSSHHRSTGMTQERTRLMKALELRKKRQQAQKERQARQTDDDMAETSSQKTQVAPKEDTSAETIPPIDGAEASPTAREKGTSFGENLSSTSGLDHSGLVFAGSQTGSDDINSTASVSSPISAQTQGSSGAPSTRPSSISEDEHAGSGHAEKPGDAEDSQGPDLVDEEQSVDSTPTIVPESRTPVPSVEVHSQPDQPSVLTESISTDQIPSIQNEEPGALRIPSDQDDSQSSRRFKRESVIYMPSLDASQPDEAQIKKRNRGSVLMPSSKRQSWYESKDKRRAMLDPLQISAENSEAEYLSDDSFMEELQSATVHEAKPMMVSKSPITPFFPRKSSASDLSTPFRSTSQPQQGVSRLSPEQLGRKASGAWPPPSNADTVVVAKKINVSSGISQRIKALAAKSNRESASLGSPVTATLDTPSSTVAQRKSSFFATTPVETSPNGRPVTRLGSPSFLTSSAPTTPDKKLQPQPVKSTVYNVQRGAEKPESVQVTARIVRDERTKKPTLAMPTENTPLELHASPLIIDHQRPTFTPRSPTRGRAEPTSPKAHSSHSREQSNSRASSESTWRTFGRRHSESKSVHSHDVDEDKRDDKKEKKESRTSKMFKRMSSSMSSMPWKNSSHNMGLTEQDVRSTSLFSLREPPPPVHVGDLNIQFPDTLVRYMPAPQSQSGANLKIAVEASMGGD